MPLLTGSYQSVINKVFHLRQKQRLIRSQQQQQSKRSNYTLPYVSAVSNYNGSIQQVDVSTPPVITTDDTGSSAHNCCVQHLNKL